MEIQQAARLGLAIMEIKQALIFLIYMLTMQLEIVQQLRHQQ